MIVTCPSCQTKFEIPDDKYRPGRKARCSNCGTVFVLPEPDEAAPSPPRPAPAPEPGPAKPASAPASAKPIPIADFDFPEPTGQAVSTTEIVDDILDQTLPDAIGSPDAPGDAVAGTGGGMAEEAPAPPVPPAAVEDVVVPPAGKAKAAGKPKNKKTLLLVLGIILAVALLSFGGVMVYSVLFGGSKTSDPQRATDGGVVDSLGGQTTRTGQDAENARQAAVRRLALESVRQYTVSENGNTGPMMVVEGTVVNNFDSPKDLILLEVTLFDRQGDALKIREQYCGVTLTPLQLRTLNKAAIENALTDQANIIINNTDIPPGGKVPFITVFFDLPKSAHEFEVKIVDVQDPAPQGH